MNKKTNEEAFNKVYPVGSTFATKLKEQEFPYGEWEYQYLDVITGFHYFKRVK